MRMRNKLYFIQCLCICAILFLFYIVNCGFHLSLCCWLIFYCSGFIDSSSEFIFYLSIFYTSRIYFSLLFSYTSCEILLLSWYIWVMIFCMCFYPSNRLSFLNFEYHLHLYSDALHTCWVDISKSRFSWLIGSVLMLMCNIDCGIFHLIPK